MPSLGGVQGTLFKGRLCWGVVRRQRGNAPQPPRRAQWHLLIDEGCRKCFCVTFDKSNKTRRKAAKEKGSDYLKRTISGMVGKGSLRHNNRTFHAGNVDPERSHQNIAYCDENIRDVYHELFDKALEKYNAKQTRTDRMIDDYYEKIRFGKQEKPFHEIIMQIGDWENTAVDSDTGRLATEILDEYMKGFAERNPNLRVFSAHLHLDEATPHLHIDFVPFIKTDGKRGLETRVSLKQALKAQGFVGVHKKDSEWARWIQAEKEQLAAIMERHGIEWEHKEMERPHLDVLDYKLQERQRELAELDAVVKEKTDEANILEKQIENLTESAKVITTISQNFENEPEYQLPEPTAMMSARSYKTKFVDPLIKRLKALVIKTLSRYFEARTDFEWWRTANHSLASSNERLKNRVAVLENENQYLREDLRDYKLLRKVFGSRQIDDLLEQARTNKGKRRDERSR